MNLTDIPEPEAYDSQDGFLEDTGTHLGLSFRTVGEDDGHFFDFESELPCSVFHFDLEGIPDEPDPVEVDGLENLPGIADETGSGIPDLDAGNKPHIGRSIV